MMSAKSASNAGGGDGEHSFSPHGVAGAGGGGGGSRVSHGGIGGAHSGQSAQRSGSPVGLIAAWQSPVAACFTSHHPPLHPTGPLVGWHP